MRDVILLRRLHEISHFHPDTFHSKTRSRIPVIYKPIGSENWNEAAEIHPNPAIVYP
jgi:hypothetical protein